MNEAQPASLVRAHLDAHLTQMAARLTGDVEESPDLLTGVEAQAAARGISLPLDRLRDEFSINGPAMDVLLATLVLQLDLASTRRVAARHGIPRLIPGTVDGPSVTLMESLLGVRPIDGAASPLRSPKSPLGRLGLLVPSIEWVRPGLAWDRVPVHVPDHWVATLVGERRLSAELSPFAERIEAAVPLEIVVLSDEWRETLAHTLTGFFRGVPAPSLFVDAAGLEAGLGIAVVLSGAPGTGKTLLAKGVAHRLDRALITIDGAGLAGCGRASELLHILFVEAQLYGEILCVASADALLGPAASLAPTFLRLLREHYACVILEVTDDARLDPRVAAEALLRFKLTPPEPHARSMIWTLHAPDGVEIDPALDVTELAQVAPLTGLGIRNAMELAVTATRPATGHQRPALGHPQLARTAELQPRSEPASSLLVPRPGSRSLDELILTEEVRTQIHEILRAIRCRGRLLGAWGLERVFRRGLGILCLFDGPSGVGKTHCAECIAAEAGLELMQVRSAHVTDKYIGEAEKHLEHVFESSDPARHVLLFDEADGFFAKRTSVGRSTDRYSNMEINTLLQLTERHTGVVILTTNLKDQIDKAFERRMTYKVNFEMPDPEMRARIWRSLLPSEMPLDEDVDIDALASDFALSGGSIKTVILRAAYAAADTGRVTHALLVDNAVRELAACGVLVRIPASR